MKPLQKNTEAILHSIDGMTRAEARPFMHTRVMARIQQQEKSVWAKAGYFLTKPLVAFTCLVAIAGTNAYFVWAGEQATNEAEPVANTATTLPADDTYMAAMNNNYLLTSFEP